LYVVFKTQGLQILYPDHADELKEGFTIQQGEKVAVGMKSNKDAGSGGIPAVAWKTLVIKGEDT
jgi:hypothetical protein